MSRSAPLLAIAALAAFVAAVWASWPSLERSLEGLGTLQLGLLASFVAGLFTAVGAIPIFFLGRISRPLEDSLLGFGAGVMLAATAFELVLPAVGIAEQAFQAPWRAALVVSLGIGIGGGFMLLLHRVVPHEHFRSGPQSGADAGRVRRVWLFVFAIALHNLPEGLAVGVGFGGEDLASGVALAIGIGLQNIPEGLVVAVALMSLGYRRSTAFGVTLLTGLVQPLGGLLGAGAITLMASLLPWALAFAAGAMLFVVSHEIIPESHRQGHEGKATFGVLLGFMVMLTIDVVLDA